MRPATRLLLPLALAARLATSVAAQDPAGPSASTFDSLAGERYGALVGVRSVVRYAADDSLVAVRVLELVDGQAPLPGLPDSVPDGVVTVLTHAPAAFDALVGDAVPEWRAGVAVPSERMLVLPLGEGPGIQDVEVRRTLRHEWAHLGLHQAVGDLRVPRWFDEGYAQWATLGFDAAEAWRLRVALALRRTPPLDSLTLRWPVAREEARTAYLLAASALSYLLEAGGEDGLAAFLDNWNEDRSFDGAFRRTFGLTVEQFEEDWKRHVRRRYGWLLVLSHSSVFWGLVALVLLVLVRVGRSRNREKLARLRAVEPPDEPAYWMGDAAFRPGEGTRGPDSGDNRAP